MERFNERMNGIAPPQWVVWLVVCMLMADSCKTGFEIQVLRDQQKDLQSECK
jgi:hypothetical protein